MREWVITNGIGGFASSTDIGMNTRRYHGMLIASLNPPGLRKLILSKVDESIEIGGTKYNLYTNESQGKISDGYKYIEKFEKYIIPIYTYKIKNVIVEKSICMMYGKNTVAIVYRVVNQKAKAKLLLTPIVNFRDFHSLTHDLEFKYKQKIYRDKVTLDFGENKGKINICVQGSKYIEHKNDIFYSMYYEKEEKRGFEAEENHAVPGTFEVEIKPNEDKEITFLCSLEGEYGSTIEELSRLSGSKIIENEKRRINAEVKESKLLENKYLPIEDEEKQSYIDLVNKYIIASDNFIVYRPSMNSHTLIAGYPWFLDWGRDTLISFEGILLISKRFEIAKQVLLMLANSIKQGLVPNGFDEYDMHPLYNSVDASLLFFEAVYKYLMYTGDYKFIKESLYHRMIKIIDNYLDGINLDNNNIRFDEKTYLISSGTLDTQNTWMDAKVNGVPVTPRNGKAVEINALWYNALKIMQELSKKFLKIGRQFEYGMLAQNVQKSFIRRFYNPYKKCLYDVLGDDLIRPNQIFAISTSFTVLDCDKDMAKEVFVTVTQKLLNKYGLQTLANGEKGFVSVYEGSPEKRDSSYHQGITWPWLLGPYFSALKNMIKAEKNEANKQRLKHTLMQFKLNVASTFTYEITNGNTIGSICEIYDSVLPTHGKGAIAQCWSIAEIFRILLDKEE